MKRSYERPILTKQRPLAAITAQVGGGPWHPISPWWPGGGAGEPPGNDS